MDKEVHSVTASDKKWFCTHRKLKENDVVLVAIFPIIYSYMKQRRTTMKHRPTLSRMEMTTPDVLSTI